MEVGAGVYILGVAQVHELTRPTGLLVATAGTEETVKQEIPREEYERIEKMIEDGTSPVGIDAKKTHIIIIHKLISLESRLARLERERGPG
jgi:hypothetical protein